MRAADRVRLPVPLDRIPTVYPPPNFRTIKPTVSAFRKLLKYWRDRLPVRSAFEPHNQCDWWGSGDCRQLVNPATGLLMVGGIDSAGNPYGSCFHLRLDTHVVSDLPDLPSDLDGYWDDPVRRWEPAYELAPAQSGGPEPYLDGFPPSS
jgi:hypothetical protein